MLSLREITQEYLGALRYVEEIERDLRIGEYVDVFALIGPRRVGKTFSLLKKAEELLKSGKQVIYASFDEPSLRNVEVRRFAELVKKEYPEGRVYLFLDEVQEWKDWEFNLRWLHDVKDFRIYVSGSSSTLMSSEIPKRLRGRYVSRVLYPLSFREIARFEVRDFRGRGRVLRLLEDYLKWGGFPEVWTTKSREKIVSLLETAFYRDVVERFGIRDVELFKSVFYFVLSNYSNSLSYRSLNQMLKDLGVEIDVKTLINYVNYVKQAFLLFTVDIFAHSQRRRMVNPKKLYVVDTSFANLFPSPLDVGRKMENLVFIELLRRKAPIAEISYYKMKDGREVDFVVSEAGQVKELIEVSYRLEREHVSKVLDALLELKLREGTIVTWDEEDSIRRGDKTVKVIPLWRWLLETQRPKPREEGSERYSG